MDIKKVLAEWGINAVALAGGMIGVVLSITLKDGPMTFRAACAVGASGLACAGYGTTLVVERWQVTSPGWIGSIGLMMGLLGMYFMLGCIRVGKQFSKDPIGTFKSIRNAKTPPDKNVDTN